MHNNNAGRRPSNPSVASETGGLHWMALVLTPWSTRPGRGGLIFTSSHRGVIHRDNMRRLHRVAGHVMQDPPAHQPAAAATLPGRAAPGASSQAASSLNHWNQSDGRRSALHMERMRALGFIPAAIGGDGSPVRAEHITELRAQGYTIVQDMVDAEWLGCLRQTYEQLVAAEGGIAAELDRAPEAMRRGGRLGWLPGCAADGTMNNGYRQVMDLVNKGPVFDAVWSHPALLALVGSVLPDFKLFSLNSLDPKLGHGHQVRCFCAVVTHKAHHFTRDTRAPDGNFQALGQITMNHSSVMQGWHRDTLAGPEPEGGFTVVNAVRGQRHAALRNCTPMSGRAPTPVHT